MKFILALQGNLVYVCIVHHTCTKDVFERQELFVYRSIFVVIILEISGNLTLERNERKRCNKYFRLYFN